MKRRDVMNRCLKIRTPGWCVRFMLMSALALALFFIYSTSLFTPACVPGTSLDASGGSTNCSAAIAAQVNAGALILANDGAEIMASTPSTQTGTNITVPFTFTSVVKDHRGSTRGWALLAASAGVINGTTIIPINLTANDAASTCSNGSCPNTTFTAITLTATATTFLTAGSVNGTVIIDGDYTNKTDGTFTIPYGSPAGRYAGTITITLSSIF